MFPQEQRIGLGQQILIVLRKGYRCKADTLICSFIKKPGRMGKVAVIVSTKVSKKAVTRNLLKRRVHAILQSQGLPEGDLVIRLDKQAKTIDFSELRRQLELCLKKLP